MKPILEDRYNKYLIQLLAEEAQSVRAELDSMRNSLRYRIGSLILEAFPPTFSSFTVLWRLIDLYRKRKHLSTKSMSTKSISQLPEDALRANILIFGSYPSLVLSNRVWCTESALLLALRLDEAPVKVLVLHKVAEPVMRRLARLHQQGCRIVWWPKPNIEHDSAMLAYMQSHADECRSANDSGEDVF